MLYSELENGPVEIVDVPMNSMVIVNSELENGGESFVDLPGLVIEHSHGIDGPFIDDFPSYKPVSMRDFPWLC